MGACCSCCARGGCCNNAPPLIQLDCKVAADDGTIKRINLLYAPCGCTSNAGTGVIDEAPLELFQRGLKPAVWQQRAEQLLHIRGMRSTRCHDWCCCMSAATLACGLVLPCYCGRKKAECDAWDECMRKWQDDFNEQVLLPLGMRVKTRSLCTVSYSSNSSGGTQKNRHISRWLAFAMNPQEAELLHAEAHVQGDIEGGCCGGPDEAMYCMHP